MTVFGSLWTSRAPAVAAFDEMVLGIAREVDRQSPVPAR
ncbi:hypothetical protein F4557_000004 [Actinomadura catellatispora]|uniref:Uncharacterized protein n=1 Tax=Actinomadura livida TaxID=79909 RepID=A0A7W7I739_9ACTN|nr:hypothetical protein [Actinomadura catellatispora]